MPTDAPTQTHIPVLDLGPELEALGDEINAAIQRVLRSGQFIGGPEVRAFEDEVARWLEVRHAVGLNSGTDALVIALRALGVGPGDEVVTTSFTFFATAEAVLNVGATPVFADINPQTFNLDAEHVEAAVTPRTRVLMPVHLFGRPAAMDALGEIAERHGVHVVEDCAQSFGARFGGRMTGTLGDLGAYSFFPTKNLGAYGDGGLLTTDDDALAETARKLRAHGGTHKYHNEIVGYNSRLDALQAAILRVKLPHVEANNAARRALAARYNEAFADLDLETPELVDGHVMHQYTVRIPGGRRDAVQHALAERGVQTMVYYPVPCHRLPVLADAPHRSLPKAERASAEVLSLPLWPQMTEAVQERVIDTVRDAMTHI